METVIVDIREQAFALEGVALAELPNRAEVVAPWNAGVGDQLGLVVLELPQDHPFADRHALDEELVAHSRASDAAAPIHRLVL
jgi:hypothetical protein